MVCTMYSPSASLACCSGVSLTQSCLSFLAWLSTVAVVVLFDSPLPSYHILQDALPVPLPLIESTPLTRLFIPFH
jgi:hypothetical protein